jgi:glycosyltransferase involved in cell wall biosynthesis
MRCLYIVFDDPITPNGRNGNTALYYEQLMALADLGFEIVLWHQIRPEVADYYQEWIIKEPWVWANVKERLFAFHLTRFNTGLDVGCTDINDSRLIDELQNIIKLHDPDVIWAQHYLPALTSVTQKDVPVIYAHHDWYYRVLSLRMNRPENQRLKGVEENLAKSVSSVVSGSYSECQELKRIGSKNVHYIPVSYKSEDINWDRAVEQPRIVHFGGLANTANQKGLQRFLDVVWPSLSSSKFQLEIIGDMSEAPVTLVESLSSFICHGHVLDLASVMNPGDIRIVPWEHSTGQRTSVPMAFNFGQIVVATGASVKCFPEAVDGFNCRLVENLEDMAPIIVELMRNDEQRLRLAKNAKDTFQKQFTRVALLERYRKAFNSCLP